MSSGWVKIHRKVKDCWIYDCKPFDYFHAWYDLISDARHNEIKLLIDGKPETISRGQLITSTRVLAEKWGWSKDKVTRFLRTLELDGMIKRKCDRRKTLLTIVNYGFYQDEQDTDKDTNEDTDKDTDKDVNKKERIKEYNNNNNTVSKDTVRPTQTSDSDIQRVISAWNELQAYDISPVSRITEGTKRHDMLVKRLKQYSLDDILRAISYVKDSPFLLGGGNKGWTITFEWFIRPNNFPKVLDGYYLPKGYRKDDGTERGDDECLQG